MGGAVGQPPKLLRRIGTFLLEILSFGSARARAINFGGILLILTLWPTDWLHYMPVRSVWENVFGFRPYSSGMMRALSRLLHGDVEGAWDFNKLAFIALPLMVWLCVANGYRWFQQTRTLRTSGAPTP